MKQYMRIMFRNPKGAFQFLTYGRKAKHFWKTSRIRLFKELHEFVTHSSDEVLHDVTIGYANRLGFSELRCDKNEIRAFSKSLERFGNKQLIADLIDFGTNTKLVSMLIAPALAASEGIGVAPKIANECIYTLGLCHPISADMCDCVLDGDVPRHSKIHLEDWIISYKVGAASLFYLGQRCARTLDERVTERLNKGIDVVSEAQKLDLKAKSLPHVPLTMIEKIYDGKIGEIEATIFSCIDILGGCHHPQFEQGALAMANEVQMQDDAQELLGEGGHPRPAIPNPSFFLYYCREYWRKRREDLETIMREAALKALDKGEEYHRKVEFAYNRLEPTFLTRPFFEIILSYMHGLFFEAYNAFLRGRTFPLLKTELAKLINT